MVEKYNENLNSIAEKLAVEHCEPEKECVFIVYNDNQKKIGSYFGKETELSSTTINEMFDCFYLNDKNNDRYVYDSFDDLLNYIDSNIKEK